MAVLRVDHSCNLGLICLPLDPQGEIGRGVSRSATVSTDLPAQCSSTRRCIVESCFIRVEQFCQSMSAGEVENVSAEKTE